MNHLCYSTEPPLKKKKISTSTKFLDNPVFEFFSYYKEDDTEKAKCNDLYCKYVTDNPRKTYNLIQHLQGHKELFEKYEKSLELKKKINQKRNIDDDEVVTIKLKISRAQFLRSTIGVVTEDFQSFNKFESPNISFIWNAIGEALAEVDGQFTCCLEFYGYVCLMYVQLFIYVFMKKYEFLLFAS